MHAEASNLISDTDYKKKVQMLPLGVELKDEVLSYDITTTIYNIDFLFSKKKRRAFDHSKNMFNNDARTSSVITAVADEG